MKRFVPLLFVLLLAGIAFAQDVTVSQDVDEVSLPRNGSAGIVFTVDNKSSANQCISFYAHSAESTITTHVSEDEICLNAGERTTVTLSIVTYFTPVAIYDVQLDASYSGETVSRHVIVKVTGAEVEFVPTPVDVCRGARHTVSIKVKNNTNRVKHVSLRADNESFLPVFSPSQIDLAPFESMFVDLEFYVSSSTAEGTYPIGLYASTGSSSYADELVIQVSKCVTPQNYFSLHAGTGCTSIDKNRSIEISVVLENHSSEEQAVRVSVDSDIPTTVPGTIVLQPGESRTVSFDVNARLNDEPGEHTVGVYAWNQFHSETAEICVKVNKIRISKVTLVSDNSIEIEQGSMGLYVIRIENKGDYKDDFNLLALDRPKEGEVIKFSRSDFPVDKGNSADVYVSVSIPCDMNSGSYDFNLLVKRNNSPIYSKQLSFRVLEAVFPPEEAPPVEIKAYPKSIKIEAGSFKRFYFQLKNNTAEEIRDLRINLLYLPSGITITPNRFDLSPQEIVNISGVIAVDEHVDEGSYTGKIELVSNDLRILSDISVYVNPVEFADSDEEEEEQPAFAGFFSLGTGFLIGFVVILFIALLLLGSADKKKAESEWVGG